MRFPLALLLLTTPVWAQPLTTLPEGNPEWVVSPDGRQAAWWVPGQLTVGNQTLKADEFVPARFPDGSWALFSPDSQAVAYSQRVGQKWSLVVNGKPQSPPPDGPGQPTFLPVGHSLAYVVAKPQGRAVNIAGRDLPIDPGTKVEGLRVSGDGRVAAFLCQKAGGWYVALGSSVWRCQPGQKIIEAVLNPDGSQLVWVEDGPNGKTLVFNGRKMGDFQEVKRIVFSPDGTRYLAVVVPKGGGTSYLVREDKDTIAKPGIDIDYPVWDPQSHEFVWGEKSGGKWTVWGRLHPEAPESLNAVPLAYTTDGKKIVLLVLGSQQTIQVGSVSSAPFDGLSLPIRTVGNTVSFAVRRGRELYAETLNAP